MSKPLHYIVNNLESLCLIVGKNLNHLSFRKKNWIIYPSQRDISNLMMIRNLCVMKMKMSMKSLQHRNRLIASCHPKQNL
jgi:hypothetical protein